MVFILLSALLALKSVHAALDPTQMQQRLAAGAPILGTFNDNGGELSNWMGTFPDDKYLVNIPGPHDSCAWNYTGLLPELINTQSLPIFSQLDAGIRFLDIRFGINNGKINVYHGDALLSDTVQIEDILWGLYHFLDVHPKETLIVSLKVDHGDANDATLQKTLHDQFTTAPTNDYWVQDGSTGGSPATRGKIILYRRYSFLPDLSPVGIDVSQNWKDNDADFVINYSPQGSAYIEDLYQITGDNQSASDKIKIKFDDVTRHLDNANGAGNVTQLFITFASGSGAGAGNLVTPKVLAVGDPANNVPGVNQLMFPWIQQRKGNRFGIVLYDFFQSEPGLVAATIGLTVNVTSSTGTGSPTKSGTSAQPTRSSSALATAPFLPIGVYLVTSCLPLLALAYF